MTGSAIRLGLSSGSAPRLSAAALAELTLACGGTVVDLRAGKGQNWEGDGLREVRAAGVEVSFVGIGTVLGDPRFAPEEAASEPSLEPGRPVKVFAAEGCTEPDRIDLTIRQIDALVGVVGRSELVLVETHHGYAPVAELLDLHARTGVRILLDTMGLARLDPDPLGATRLLAPYTAAAQVKGFDWTAPDSSRHLPLRSGAGPTREMLRLLPHLTSVTVESKAGTPEDDLAVLRTWLAGPVPTSQGDARP